MKAVFLIMLFVLGTCFGSFLCCEVRRAQLRRSTKKRKHLGSRSVCMHCHYQLKWYDNLPIISWVLLRGKCRKCHQPIGYAELLSEIGIGLAFLIFGATFDYVSATPLDWVTFVITLVFILALGFLAIYDGISGELPMLFLGISLLLSLVLLGLNEYSIISTIGFSPELIWKPLMSVAILGGLYLILYVVSKGKWVGDGDWILATAIAIAIFHPSLALTTLFLANFTACIIMLPSVIKKHEHKIYFGPFLVIAFVIVGACSHLLLTVLPY